MPLLDDYIGNVDKDHDLDLDDHLTGNQSLSCSAILHSDSVGLCGVCDNAEELLPPMWPFLLAPDIRCGPSFRELFYISEKLSKLASTVSDTRVGSFKLEVF